MTPKRQPIGRPRSRQSEDAILNAVLELLVKEGYAGMTLDKVAKLAGASKSTMYRRWESKEHLILAAFNRLPVVVPKDLGNVLAELEDLHAQYLPMMDNSPLRSVFPMLAAECARNPTLYAMMESLNEQRRVPFKLIFRRAIKRGELPQNTDIDLAIETLQGAIANRMYFLLGDIDRDWMRKQYKFILRGAGAKI